MMIKETLIEIIELAETGETNWCATLEDEKQNWIQITWDSLNLKFPYSQPPEEVLNQKQIILAPNMEISGHEKESYLTLSHGGYETEEITTIIRDYFDKIFQATESSLTVKKEEL
ncbi:MAG: hypothetical protein ACSHX8_13975 [Opitutaceae bacterium]